MPKHMHELSVVFKQLKLTDYQSQALTMKIIDYLNLNEELSEDKPQICPKCKETQAIFTKSGKTANGKQRYLCHSCHSRFVSDCLKLTYYSQQSTDRWAILICDTLSLVPALETASKLDLSERSVLNLRYKFMVACEDMMNDEVILEDVIEMDETFYVESNKGTKTTLRPPRHRKGPASKRGLSNEQMCILVATNRNGLSFSKVIDRGKPSEDNIVNSLNSHIRQSSTIITDGLTSYNKLVSLKAHVHYIVKSHHEYDKCIHLNTVNSIHSHFSQCLTRYRGVASKHLNRYTAMMIMIRQCRDMDHEEALFYILKKLKNRFCYHSLRDCRLRIAIV